MGNISIHRYGEMSSGQYSFGAVDIVGEDYLLINSAMLKEYQYRVCSGPSVHITRSIQIGGQYFRILDQLEEGCYLVVPYWRLALWFRYWYALSLRKFLNATL